MKPNRVGQRFWVPHSSHCVTISALPPPPHFSCQEGQQKAGRWGDEGGWAKNLLTDCFTHWLTRALSAEADWKACQLTTNRYLFFNLEKPSLFQIGKTWVFVTWEFFQISKVKKFMGLGSHVLLAEALLAGINIMVCWGLSKKGGSDRKATVE